MLPWIQVRGSEGRGVANISPMLTITRLHNSISAVGAMRRYAKLNNHSSLKIITNLFETLYGILQYTASVKGLCYEACGLQKVHR